MVLRRNVERGMYGQPYLTQDASTKKMVTRPKNNYIVATIIYLSVHLVLALS